MRSISSVAVSYTHLACGIEVGTTFAAADRQTSQGVFEDLFKAQEFNYARVYCGMESQTTFVRTDSGVELLSLIHI